MEPRSPSPEHTQPHYEIQFGAYDTKIDLHPQLCAYGLRLYAEVRRAYEAKDCPLGPSDEAMLVWFTFGGPEGNNATAGCPTPDAARS